MSTGTSPKPTDDLGREPLIRARELVAFWHALWGSCERLNDVPFDSRWLHPWVDDIAIFELVDHGADFRTHQVGSKLAAFLGGVGSGTMLSEFPLPYRQRLRQVLLRAAVSRAPAAENYNWLVEGDVRSCIACAMPVAGGFYRPSRLLLAIFHRTLEFLRLNEADRLAPIDPASDAVSMVAPQILPLSVSRPLPGETLQLGGGPMSGSAAISPIADMFRILTAASAMGAKGRPWAR